MPKSTVTIKHNERVFIAGKTGSGKTYLARRLLRPYRRLVVIDTKGTLGGWGLEPWDRDARRKLRRGEPIRARVLFDLVDPTEAIRDLFQDLYEIARDQAGSFVLYIDETYGVVDFGGKPDPGMTALYTRGRELGIGVWSATQRPFGVPLIMKSEAEHHFMFRLVLARDRDHMAEFMGEEVANQVIPDDFGFFYKRIDWDEVVYIPRFQEEMIVRTVSNEPTKQAA